MILVTNDDGIESAGLKALASALESLNEVYVVAPDRERSAILLACRRSGGQRGQRVCRGYL